MAISWKLTVTPINISTHEASIDATRTDDDPVTGSVWIGNVAIAKIETPAEQLAVAQEILAKRQAYLNTTTAVADFIDETVSAGKTYLETNDIG